MIKSWKLGKWCIFKEGFICEPNWWIHTKYKYRFKNDKDTLNISRRFRLILSRKIAKFRKKVCKTRPKIFTFFRETFRSLETLRISKAICLVTTSSTLQFCWNVVFLLYSFLVITVVSQGKGWRGEEVQINRLGWLKVLICWISE